MFNPTPTPPPMSARLRTLLSAEQRQRKREATLKRRQRDVNDIIDAIAREHRGQRVFNRMIDTAPVRR